MAGASHAAGAPASLIGSPAVQGRLPGPVGGAAARPQEDRPSSSRPAPRA
jgi:hypothetical protein